MDFARNSGIAPNRKKTAAALEPTAVFSLGPAVGAERQALMGAGLLETAKQLPGSGPSSLAQRVRALVRVLPVPVPAQVLPLPVSRRLLAFSVPLFSEPLFSVLLCLVLPSSARLF
jgi:hypothetical protein